MTKRRRKEPMKSWNEIHSERVSGINEWHARTAIRDLLEEHKGSMTAVQLKLSLWLEEEFLRRLELKELPHDHA
jgi:hypothetical protein